MEWIALALAGFAIALACRISKNFELDKMISILDTEIILGLLLEKGLVSDADIEAQKQKQLKIAIKRLEAPKKIAALEGLLKAKEKEHGDKKDK